MALRRDLATFRCHLSRAKRCQSVEVLRASFELGLYVHRARVDRGADGGDRPRMDHIFAAIEHNEVPKTPAWDDGPDLFLPTTRERVAVDEVETLDIEAEQLALTPGSSPRRSRPGKADQGEQVALTPRTSPRRSRSGKAEVGDAERRYSEQPSPSPCRSRPGKADQGDAERRKSEHVSPSPRRGYLGRADQGDGERGNAEQQAWSTPRSRLKPQISRMMPSLVPAARVAAPLMAPRALRTQLPPVLRNRDGRTDVEDAAEVFDRGHELNAAAGRKALRKLRRDCTSKKLEIEYQMTLASIRINRFHVQPLRVGGTHTHDVRRGGKPDLQLEGVAGGPWSARERVRDDDAAVLDEGEAPVRKPWKLETSIWAPRRKWSEARAFWDTPESMRAALECDHRKARAGGGLDRVLEKAHTAASPPMDAEALASAAKAVLLAHVDAVYACFDLYASVGATTSDLSHMQLNAYKQMLTDADMVETSATGLCASRWDELFVAVNAAAQSVKEGSSKYNHQKGLNRQEYLNVLLRAAVMMHSEAGGGSVPKAIEKLLGETLLPRVRRSFADAGPPGYDALAPANAFRNEHCYIESTSEVLSRHLAALTLLYERYSVGDGAVGDEIQRKEHMDFGEWMSFVNDMAIVDDQFAERSAISCFVASRLRVVDEVCACACGFCTATRLLLHTRARVLLHPC